MPGQVGAAGFQIFQIGHAQLLFGAAAVMFQCAHGGHDHHRRGRDARHAALDVQEFLGAQVRAEARLGDHIVRQLHAQLGGDDAVAAVGDVGEGAAVDQRGGVFQRLDQVGVKGVLQQSGHGARRADLTGGDGFARVGIALSLIHI